MQLCKKCVGHLPSGSKSQEFSSRFSYKLLFGIIIKISCSSQIDDLKNRVVECICKRMTTLKVFYNTKSNGWSYSIARAQTYRKTLLEISMHLSGVGQKPRFEVNKNDTWQISLRIFLSSLHIIEQNLICTD